MAARPLILYYNPSWTGRSAETCPEDFELSADRRRLREASAVVVHVPSLGPGPLSDALPPRSPGQVWVAHSLESEVNYPRLADPCFMARFDLTMTYRRDADVWCPYLGPDLAAPLLDPPRPKTESATAVYFCRNPHDRSGRTRYAFELMKRLRVDSYGTVLLTRVLSGPDRGRDSKLETIARYHFTLAFENSVAADYVTEKFFDPLGAGSVPVYLGAPNVADFAPGRRCFVDTRDFAGPAALAEHLLALVRDPPAYEAYLEWKREPLRPAFLELLTAAREPALARLCARLRERGAGRPGHAG